MSDVLRVLTGILPVKCVLLGKTHGYGRGTSVEFVIGDFQDFCGGERAYAAVRVIISGQEIVRPFENGGITIPVVRIVFEIKGLGRCRKIIVAFHEYERRPAPCA